MDTDPSAQTPLSASSAAEGATRALKRGASSSGHATGQSSTGGSQIELSKEALRDEEIGRLRVSVNVFASLAALGMLIILMAGGNPTAKGVFGLGLVSAMSTMALMWWIFRDPTRYRPGLVGIGGIAVAVSVLASIFYFGAFSSAAMIGSLGLYIFCLGSTTPWAISLYLFLALGHACLAGLIFFGVIPDLGLIKATGVATIDQIAVHSCIQAVYVVAVVAGIASRRRLGVVFSDLENAVRKISQRDALLQEAKRELERAAWVGGEGRFTGQVLSGFTLGNVIGRGGMGEVYEGSEAGSEREVAVKLLQRGAFSDPHSVARFSREAQLAASIDSPYVVRVIEVSGADAAIAYLVMERLRGEDLASMLRREKRLSTRDLIKLSRQVAAGLDAAHEKSVVHRDLKPQNLFYTRREDGSHVWKILDFGVAKQLGQGSLTGEQIVGTPEYMAPEQAMGKDVSSRTDLYGLCAVLYRCMFSRPPFSDPSLPALIRKVAEEPPPRPSSLSRVSADIDAFFTIGLAKNAQDRFESGAALAENLWLALAESLPEELRARARTLWAAEPPRN